MSERSASTTAGGMVKADSEALIPSNPSVVHASAILCWKPETVIERVQRALPTRAEQQLYLEVGVQFHILPETFNKLMRILLAGQTLQSIDPTNTVTSQRLAQTADFLDGVLTILGKTESDFAEYALSAENAGKLVLYYGNSAQDIVSDAVANVGSLRQLMGLHSSISDKAVIGIALQRIIESAESSSRCNVLDVVVFFQDEQKDNRRSDD